MFIHQQKNSQGDRSYEAFILRNASVRPHFHRNYELFNILEGSIELVIDGRHSVVKAGEFAFCLSNEVHEVHPIGQARYWCGVFSPDYVPEFHSAVAGKAVLECQFQCDEGLLPYLQENLLFHGTPNPYRLSAALYMICGEFLRNAILIERANPEYALMNDIVDYIAKNYQSKLSLKDVSAALGYDYYYFSKLFHQTFGQSFNEYLSTYRFNIALGAIRSTKNPISQIASDSGFQSIRSFNDVFLKRTGLSPAQYRKQLNA